MKDESYPARLRAARDDVASQELLVRRMDDSMWICGARPYEVGTGPSKRNLPLRSVTTLPRPAAHSRNFVRGRRLPARVPYAPPQPFAGDVELGVEAVYLCLESRRLPRAVTRVFYGAT